MKSVARPITEARASATGTSPHFFFFNDTPTTEIYTTYDTLSLHDALPISWMRCSPNLTRTLFSAGLGLVLLAGCARVPVIPSAPLTVTAEELVILLREREIAVRTLKAQFAVE